MLRLREEMAKQKGVFVCGYRRRGHHSSCFCGHDGGGRASRTEFTVYSLYVESNTVLRFCLQRVPREYSTTSRTTVSRMIPRTVNSVRKTRRYYVCTISTGTQDAERDTWWDSKKLRTTAVTQSKNQTRTNCNRADTINTLLTLFCS